MGRGCMSEQKKAVIFLKIYNGVDEKNLENIYHIILYQ